MNDVKLLQRDTLVQLNDEEPIGNCRKLFVLGISLPYTEEPEHDEQIHAGNQTHPGNANPQLLKVTVPSQSIVYQVRAEAARKLAVQLDAVKLWHYDSLEECADADSIGNARKFRFTGAEVP